MTSDLPLVSPKQVESFIRTGRAARVERSGQSRFWTAEKSPTLPAGRLHRPHQVRGRLSEMNPQVGLCPASDPSLADATVDAFAQQVGVPAVPGILVDPVYQQLPNGDTVLP
jgi:hypothetical protein